MKRTNQLPYGYFSRIEIRKILCLQPHMNDSLRNISFTVFIFLLFIDLFGLMIMTPHQVQLKRLKHVGHEDRHISVLSRMNRPDSQSISSSDEISGESSESSSSIYNENSKTSRTVRGISLAHFP